MATLIAVFVMLTALLLISPAPAYYVWLDRDGPARAYFAGRYVMEVIHPLR
jgi:hypothetical protein